MGEHTPHPQAQGTPLTVGTHRKGGLGDLRAVVGDASTEAAREATTMRLLLAAHHGLHGVTAYANGPLWGHQVTGA